MWKLNKNKIDLAESKYGFVLEEGYNGNILGYSKRNSNGRAIISFDKEYKITTYGAITTPKIYQDLIYDLIKDDIIEIERESETEKINKRIQKKEQIIQKLQNEIEELKTKVMKGDK